MRNVSFFLFFFFQTAFTFGCPPPKAAKKNPPVFALSFVHETGAEPSFMITEDFDRDGNLDLVVTNSGDHTFSYFKGNGDCSFKDQIIFKTGRDPICLTAGYFNGDGYPDLAVLNYADQNIQIYLNTMRGSFRNTGKFLHPGKIPINLVAGAFNRREFGKLKIRHGVSVLFSSFQVGIGKGASAGVSCRVAQRPSVIEITDSYLPSTPPGS